MTPWIAAGFVFFLYVAAAAPLVGRLPRRRRLLAPIGSALGLALCFVALRTAGLPILHDWILPPLVLLAAYWVSGLLYAAPMPRAEAALEAVDRALHIDRLAAAAPRWLAELLEIAYLGVYPLIPLALTLHLTTTPEPDPSRFWTVILVVDFVCFGVLPWVQTRPPRAHRSVDPWRSTFRQVNLRLLGSTSIQVNTFPSGHAAEALAGALLLAGAPWPIILAMAVCAFLVSAGAVLGRYHYAADALIGWAVALAVWLS